MTFHYHFSSTLPSLGIHKQGCLVACECCAKMTTRLQHIQTHPKEISSRVPIWWWLDELCDIRSERILARSLAFLCTMGNKEGVGGA